MQYRMFISYSLNSVIAKYSNATSCTKPNNLVFSSVSASCFTCASNGLSDIVVTIRQYNCCRYQY